MTGKKPTIIDVANLAGVSKSTVSLVLTGRTRVKAQTREKVESAMASLGYIYNRDAASLKSKRTRLVGILVNNITDPLNTALALECHLAQQGYQSWLMSSQEDLERQDQLCKQLQEHKAAGLFIVPARKTSAQWLNQLGASGLSILQIMRQIEFADAPALLPDYQKGFYLAACHLIESGAGELVLLGADKDAPEFSDIKKGVAAAANTHQLPFTLSSDGEYLRSKLQQTAHANCCTGLVCASDRIALDSYLHIYGAGLTPGKDILLSGFGDIPQAAKAAPPLSSIQIDFDALAKHAFALINALFEDAAPPVRTLLDVSLKAR